MEKNPIRLLPFWDMSLWGGGRTTDPNLGIIKLPVLNTESNRGMLILHKAKKLRVREMPFKGLP